MSGGLEVLIFVVSSMAVSCLVGWRIGKTDSRKLNRLRLRAVLITVALFFTIVPLVPVALSVVLTRGVESLDYFLSMWAVSIFIVLISIMSGIVGVWAILILSLFFCLATLSISRRRSGNSDMFSEHNLVRIAQQEEFLWNVEETITQRKERQ
ncbi:hypothetical protein [Ruegeria atlantica]|uniref:Uncharacterized protein n=1 Tax=Ruegeria atlantica TaxID=81569 RepID=A0A0P1E348_9RHOB|nr:hypothetical protein [Ruegeria atlantica]CUH42966.1 hypothetical protein RUM4293_01855 [Ruegeria atlantica]